jgi:hypothetical protein
MIRISPRSAMQHVHMAASIASMYTYANLPFGGYELNDLKSLKRGFHRHIQSSPPLLRNAARQNWVRGTALLTCDNVFEIWAERHVPLLPLRRGTSLNCKRHRGEIVPIKTCKSDIPATVADSRLCLTAVAWSRAPQFAIERDRCANTTRNMPSQRDLWHTSLTRMMKTR